MNDNYRSSSGEVLDFKGLVFLIKSYISYWGQKKIWIIILGGIISSLFVFFEWRAPITYSAQLTFMINEDDNGSTSGFGSILGQFGLPGGANEYNLDRVVELSRSRRIVNKILLDSIVVDGEEDLLGNHLIKVYNYHDSWRDSENVELKDYFFSSTELNSFSRTDFYVLGILYGKIVGSPINNTPGLINTGFEPSTGILKVSTTVLSEELSYELSTLLYKELSHFYIAKSTEKQRTTLNKLDFTVDSIEAIINRLDYNLASFRDRSGSILRQRDRVSGERMQRELQVLSIMYSEALKNRETSRFILDSATPFFQVIDTPYYPLAKKRKYYLKEGIIGGGFGLFLGLVLFGFRKAYKDAMDS